MLNITELDCKNAVRPTSCDNAIRVYDTTLCCFYYICPYCLSEDGMIYEAGQTWTWNCQLCKCTFTAEIACKPNSCPNITQPTCDQPGSQLIMTTDPNNPCCLIYQCVCNTSLCKLPIVSCTNGLIPKVTNKGCCVDIICVNEPKQTTPMATFSSGGLGTAKTAAITGTGFGLPTTRGTGVITLPSKATPTRVTKFITSTVMSKVTSGKSALTSLPSGGVCMVGGSAYMPGSLVPSPPGSCQTCVCSTVMNRTNNLNIVICVPVVCNKTCTYPEVYRAVPGHCCGTCVQTACVITTADGQTKVLSVDKIWIPSTAKCLMYTCSRQSDGQLYTTLTNVTCTVNSVKDCMAGQVYRPAAVGQCCGKCVQTRCVVSVSPGNVTLLSEGHSISSPFERCLSYTCMKVGGQVVTVVSKVTCQSNSSLSCKTGEEYEESATQCCGHCVQKSCVIVTSNNEIKLLNETETFVSLTDKCTTYTCVKLAGSLVTVKLKQICQYQSQQSCKTGEEYVPPKDKCCGQCVQKSCIVSMPTGGPKLLNEGQSLTSPTDKCISYTCVKSAGQLVTLATKESCQYNSTLNCKNGEKYVPPTDQCCGQCVQTSCIVMIPTVGARLLNEGQSIASPTDFCISYTCVKSLGQLVTVAAKETCVYNSSQSCKPGEEFVRSTTQCCGQCVQKFCVVIKPNGDIKLMKENEVFRSDDSCTTYTCVKKNNQLISLAVTENCSRNTTCGLGETFMAVNNECCGKCVRTACVFMTSTNKTIVLQPGQSVADSVIPCTFYVCKKVNNKVFHEVERRKCQCQNDQDCDVDEKYYIAAGACCGRCIKIACSVTTPGGESKTLEAEETWTPTNEKCLTYGCKESNGMFRTILNNRTCDSVKPEDCESGILEVSPDGCCTKCKAPKNCRRTVGPVSLLSGDCPLNITIPYCIGVCTNATMMSSISKVEPECKCCKSLKSTKKTVNVQCKDGTTISHTYDFIQSCGCTTKQCV